MKIRQINLHMKWDLLGTLLYLSCCWDGFLQNQQNRKIYRKKKQYLFIISTDTLEKNK